MSHPRARPGPRSRLPGALLVLALVGALMPWGAPAVGAEAVGKAFPLTVRLVQLSSTVVPGTGILTLAGTVTNDSEETYGAVNVHPFLSRSPMTTRAQLAAAAATDPGVEVGERLTAIGQFAPIGDIAPGETLPFSITVPAAVLPKADGVYWIGVHALGQGTDGSRAIRGLARTFIPRVTGSSHTSVALVVPVRAEVRRGPSGRLLNPSGWYGTVDPSGRLGRIAAFLRTAGSRPLTMLLDPAVLDAVSDLAANNPPLSLGKPASKPGESPGSTASPSRSGIRTEAGDRAKAASWLDDMTTAARTHIVLGLGYADPDAAALIRQGSPLLALSTKLAAETFTALKIPDVPAVAPPSGWLDAEAVARLAPATTVLLSDHAAPRPTTRWRTSSGQDLVLTDQQTSSGGTGPTPAHDVLAIRQRIVADAALRRTQHPSDPLVVELPSDWDPGADWEQADFFNAISLPWLDLVGLSPTSDTTTPLLDAGLGYPASERKQELPVPNVSAARLLTQTSTALTGLLRSENDVAHDLAGIALNSVSVHARNDEAEARVQVLDTNTRMRARMGKVEVLGTDFVTLSGGSGTLAVTLVNGLDQPITVGVAPQTSTNDVTIAAAKPVKMAPGERTVLRLKAKASSIGVTRVVLTPVTTDGTQVGTPLAFSLRTSQVGEAIWGVLIAGGVLLVVMVLLRIRRGLREHRWRGRA